MSGPLAEVRELVVEYPLRRRFGRAGAERVRAVDGVSFELRRGEILGLVGESGCGKSTVARCLVRLTEPTSGAVRVDGRDVAELEGRDLRAFRRRAQIVFQDPFAALNPRQTVGGAVGEALRAHGLGGGPEGRAARVAELLERVGLGGGMGDRLPHELSGGERQRVSVARALALEPELLVLDEPVSSLDVSVRAQVVNLLLDLREELGLTYLFIAHDMRLVEVVCDRVAVMRAGRIVEVAETPRLFREPRHAWTRQLLAATPAGTTRTEPGETAPGTGREGGADGGVEGVAR